jgi:hypothetical protein
MGEANRDSSLVNNPIPGGRRQSIKQHPLSAVQRTKKLANNLYSVVNNKLVRNVQNQSNSDLADQEVQSVKDISL